MNENLDSAVARAVDRASRALEAEIRATGHGTVKEVSHQTPAFRAALSAVGVPGVLPSAVKHSFPSWEPREVAGRLGGVDVVVGAAPDYRAFFELKWAHGKHELGWTLWDIYKLAAGRIHYGVDAYAIVGAPVSYWMDETVDCAALYCDGTWLSREVFVRYERAWKNLLAGGTARPAWVPDRITTRIVAARRPDVAPFWELRALRIDVPGDERLMFSGDWPEGHWSGRSAHVVADS